MSRLRLLQVRRHRNLSSCRDSLARCAWRFSLAARGNGREGNCIPPRANRAWLGFFCTTCAQLLVQRIQQGCLMMSLCLYRFRGGSVTAMHTSGFLFRFWRDTDHSCRTKTPHPGLHAQGCREPVWQADAALPETEPRLLRDSMNGNQPSAVNCKRLRMLLDTVAGHQFSQLFLNVRCGTTVGRRVGKGWELATFCT